MAASELSPFAREGDLADVTGILPLEIKKLGIDVGIIIPYGSVDEKKHKLKNC